VLISLRSFEWQMSSADRTAHFRFISAIVSRARSADIKLKLNNVVWNKTETHFFYFRFILFPFYFGSMSRLIMRTSNNLSRRTALIQYTTQSKYKSTTNRLSTPIICSWYTGWPKNGTILVRPKQSEVTIRWAFQQHNVFSCRFKTGGDWRWCSNVWNLDVPRTCANVAEWEYRRCRKTKARLTWSSRTRSVRAKMPHRFTRFSGVTDLSGP